MISRLSVILLGAGYGKRFASLQPKQNYKIKGKTLTDYSRLFFQKYFSKANTFIVINKNITLKKTNSNEQLCYGSSSRLKSLYKTLLFMEKTDALREFTLVHDIARPVLNIKDINNLIKSIDNKHYGYSLGYPLTNALKLVDKNKIENLDRKNLWMTFTPQIFKTKALLPSLRRIINNKIEIDDDIEALLLNSYKCKIIKSSPANIKLTYKEDIKNIKELL